MPTSILSVRLSKSERNLLEAAAENAHTKLSDFIRRKALDAAEEELLNRNIIEIPAQKWAEMEKLLAEPAKENTAVKELVHLCPTWKQ